MTIVVPDTDRQTRQRLQGELGALLRQASGAVRTRVEEALAAMSVTAPQFSALEAIEANPGLSSADLARLLLLTPQTVAVIVANLKRAGWIYGEQHPEHGRIQKLQLTGAGAMLVARSRPAVDPLEAKLLDGFDADELAVVRRWLAAATRI